MSPLPSESCMGAWIYRYFFRRIPQCPAHEALQMPRLRLRDEMPPKEPFYAYPDRYRDHPVASFRKNRNRPVARKSGARAALAQSAEASDSGPAGPFMAKPPSGILRPALQTWHCASVRVALTRSIFSSGNNLPKPSLMSRKRMGYERQKQKRRLL